MQWNHFTFYRQEGRVEIEMQRWSNFVQIRRFQLPRVFFLHSLYALAIVAACGSQCFRLHTALEPRLHSPYLFGRTPYQSPLVKTSHAPIRQTALVIIMRFFFPFKLGTLLLQHNGIRILLCHVPWRQSLYVDRLRTVLVLCDLFHQSPQFWPPMTLGPKTSINSKKEDFWSKKGFWRLNTIKKLFFKSGLTWAIDCFGLVSIPCCFKKV